MNKIHSTLISCAVLVVFAPGAHAATTSIAFVEGTVTPQADKFLYEYNVTVGYDLVALPDDGSSVPLGSPSPLIVSQFMLPFFDTDPDTIDPCSITAPGNWTGAIQTPAQAGWLYSPLDDPESGTYGIDPDFFINPPAVLVFSTPTPLSDGVGANGPFLDGFSFLSDYNSANGPTVLVPELDATAASNTQALILDPPIVVSPSHPLFIPEPATLSLLALGGLTLLRRKHIS